MSDDHQSLVSILVRQLAAHLATPVFCVDPRGWLIYYNEPAEKVLGKRFAESGALSPEEWGTIWQPHDFEGSPIPTEELPLFVAISERRPEHRSMRITGLDGMGRTISVTAFPLFARADVFVGAMAVFWDDRD